ncbi:MAG: hypothetical protein M0Z76_08980 [Gammaproteobacteria bacterium]|nr:hypothetical protein [Gammaproteobacteria bacterium]
MSRRRIATLLVFLVFVSVIPAAFAEDALIVTLGAFHIAHTTQAVNGVRTQFSAGTNNDYNIAWEQRHYNGIAYGAQYTIFSGHVTQPGGVGSVTARLFMATLKRYAHPWPHTYPFIGASAGLADVRYGGFNARTGVGPAFAIDAGVEFELAHMIGLYTEVRGLYAQGGDIYGTNTNLSGVGVYGGLSFLF